MNADLAEFLAKHTPVDEEPAVWADGTMPLRIISYLSAMLPPPEYVASVRGIVFRLDTVLALRNMHSTHIMPGGRREPGESFEETLRREVMEEAGWTITNIFLLGFRHLRHLAPMPAGYAFPYPDFLWLIYLADAVAFVPGVAPDEYEIEATFRPIVEARGLDLTRAERIYLDAAVKAKVDAEPSRL